MRRLGGALALALAGVALAGCTLVPTSPSPATLTRPQVPFGLLDPTLPGTAHRQVRFVTQPVYMVDATRHLAPSSRIVPSPATLNSLLTELLIGPTDIERASGITSALPRGLVLVGAVVNDQHVAVITLAGPITGMSRADESLALGQLVFTAQALGATAGTQIIVSGVLQALPLPAGGTATLLRPRSFAVLLNG